MKRTETSAVAKLYKPNQMSSSKFIFTYKEILAIFIVRKQNKDKKYTRIELN